MNSTPEEIQELLDKMVADSKAMTKEVADICWYMRGSITWGQAWMLTEKDKVQIFETIKENIKRTEDTKMPLL